MEPISLEQIHPYVRYVNNYKPDYSYTQPHRVIYDFEFMYVVDGAVDIYYDGAWFPLKKADIFYFRPNVENYMIVDATRHFHTHCIHFDWLPPAEGDNFAAEDFYVHSISSPDYDRRVEALKARPLYEPADFTMPTHIHTSGQQNYLKLFSQCYYNYIKHGTAASLMLQSAFYEIIALLATEYSTQKQVPEVHPQIIRAMDYVRNHYTETITAPQLACKYGLSPKYFGFLFKKATGKALGDYVLELRIYAAKEMLLGSSLTIEEIAEKVGFCNSFYFSNCFKRMEKISPSGYRSLMRSTTD